MRRVQDAAALIEDLCRQCENLRKDIAKLPDETRKNTGLVLALMLRFFGTNLISAALAIGVRPLIAFDFILEILEAQLRGDDEPEEPNTPSKAGMN